MESPLARIMREHIATLTPSLSLAEGEGVVSIPSPPEGERDRVRGRIGRGTRVRGLLTFIPDGRYELKSFGTDEERNSVCAYGVFSGTHTGTGGPCPPTGKSLKSDYVYVMDFVPLSDQ